MAKILKFPSPRRPEIDCGNGFFGMRLDELFRVVHYYAVILEDQETAFHILDQLLELDVMDEYIGLPDDVKPTITAVPGLEDI